MIHVGTERFLADILKEHLETLELLWERRSAALRNGKESPRSLADLEERIAAHTDGLVLAADEAIGFLEEAMQGGEASMALAASYALLMMQRNDTARLVLRALVDGGAASPLGIRAGLCYGPIDAIVEELSQVLESAPGPLAVAAAEILAFHHRLGREQWRIEEWLWDEDAEVRRTAWRLVAMLDTR